MSSEDDIYPNIEEDEVSTRKRRRSDFIDEVAEEVDEEEEEEDEEDEEDEDYYTDRGKTGHRSKKMLKSSFLDLEAQVDSEDEEDEDPGEDDFIDNAADIQEDDNRRMHQRPLLPRDDDDDQDVEALEKQIQLRYARSSHAEYDEETTEVDQQALLPSVKDPKLWMVKCAVGREREVVACLMQKCIDNGPESLIKSAVALDHLKNYIYIEANKEAHVKEVISGLRTIYSNKIMLVPIKEMTDVLSVESKAVDISRDAWVRMKIGTYKGDLAKVVDVDNVRQRVTVKLVPRIDLQALASKMEGGEVVKKKTFAPPPRFMNIDEAREMNIRVERRRDPMTGDHFEKICGMSFKDGFLYKNVSMKSISTQNIQPSFDELEKFRQPGENGEGDISSLSSLFETRKKGHFMKGDQVIVIKGDLRNLKGRVEKVEENNVHIRPKEEGLQSTLAVNERELCKYFEPGNHVKVVSGTKEGSTGMVITVEGHVVIILSDTTKEHIRVFSDHIVESSEVTTGITRIGNYELHDLILLDNMIFGVIIRVESEAFQILKGVPDRPAVALVKLREIKCKLENKYRSHDRYNNSISVKDIARIIDGPCKGKQGPVEHIYRDVLFIHDRQHLEHVGYICTKSRSCVLVGGSRAVKNGGYFPERGISNYGTSRIPPSPGRLPPRGVSNFGRGRGDRGNDSLLNRTVKIRAGNYKGYRGIVTRVTGQTVLIELESQMKSVRVNRDQISDNMSAPAPHHETSRYGSGSETPMHPSRTPLHPFMTPMRDPGGATPIHDGMRTPMRDRAWNPYTPNSPSRDDWEDTNEGSWGASPRHQTQSPLSRTYEAPTPGSGWAANNNTLSGSYSEAGSCKDTASAFGSANAPIPYLPSTPGGQPMTPSSAAYLPGTPGGQPMTPGSGSLDVMSPSIGGDNEGAWFLPEILVNVRRSGEDVVVGMIREVVGDGSCRVEAGSGEVLSASPNELETVVPRKSDKVKIMSGLQRGCTGRLLGVDGSEGIVKVDETLDVKIFDMAILAKFALS